MTPTSSPTYITYVRLDAIKPHPGNAKLHDIDALIELFQRVGFIGALPVDDRTERLLGGHGRWHALVRMYAGGMSAPRGIEIDDDGQWLVPLERGWASRDDTQADAANVALNRAQELGGWDNRLYAEMLERIQADDATLFEALKYSDDEMDALLKAFQDVDGPAAMVEHTDDGELDDDMGMTDVPDGPEHEKVKCPSCGNRFRPGDKEVY